MAFTYILLTAKGSYYIGSTDDLYERFKRHRNGNVPSTRHKLPVTLVYVEEFSTKSEAQQKEYRIKGWKSKKLIESFIRKITMAPSSIG